ncbi:MAG: DNA methyltransferase [Bacteroidales bacterium]|jgi:adenine-specific DNA-methyltransferase
MSNIYEQRFYSALKDSFIGHPIKGKSGYVNLMDIKAQYFAEIEPYIKAEIDKQVEPEFREELFEKLYNFFDCYLNETGTVFFANSQIHKNLYEKVYSDRDDVALFWKTQKLYYVKSEANYEDLEIEVNEIKILFDASEIKHAKGNEKKNLQFNLVKATKDEVVFKVRYQENNKYDRLKEYLELDKNNEIIDKCLDEYGTALHPNIIFADTDLDHSVIDKKTDSRKCIFIENTDDAFNSVKVEYSISDFDLTLTYLHKKGIILYEEDLKKIFTIYKRQNEIDYFIHKDAEGFLKEQFDIYVYNWLFNDLETDFDAATVKRMQNIKKIAHKVIEYIARFEDELKAIWEKPKFVRNCNYVLTLDKLADNVELIQKIIDSPGWDNQVEEWKELNREWVDEKGNQTKKEWDEFAFANEKNFEKEIIENSTLNKTYQYLPIDTKFFPELKYQILSNFKNLDSSIDGTLIKTDNWQGLNSIKEKYKSDVEFVYIDPPFNTGSDFDYKDNYQDSTWLSIMSDRINLAKILMSSKSSFYLHLDYRANFLGRILLENSFNGNFINEIIWCYTGPTNQKNNFPHKHDTIYLYSKNKEYFFNEDTVRVKYKKSTKSGGKTALTGRKDDAILEAIDAKGKIVEDFWTDIADIGKVHNEDTRFKTQKTEKLLERIIMVSTELKKRSLVLDFFSGSATTICTAHKLNKRWIGMEMGVHFYEKNLPRIKKVLAGDKVGISSKVNWQGGGFFKYYELEQYEDVLSKAKYQWQGKEDENQVERYSFMQDQKLLDAIEIDYKNKNAKVVFENLYPDVDIAETLSNISGKHIKQVFEDKVVFEDNSEIVYAEMTFEKYPWIKPLIWWNSK